MFKENKQGQTHFYGDGCKDKSHNNPIADKIFKFFQDYADKNELEDVRLAVEAIRIKFYKNE